MRTCCLIPFLLTTTARAQLPEPLVPRVDVETLAWELEQEISIRTGEGAVPRLGRTEDRDGDGLAELVIALDGRVSVHGSLDGRRLELREGSAVAGEQMAVPEAPGALPAGRFRDPAWNPSGGFGERWILLEADGEGLPERIVADPRHASTGALGIKGAQEIEGALHLFREDGTRLASRRGGGREGARGLGRALVGLDPARDGRAARFAAGDGNGLVVVYRIVRRSGPSQRSARVRLERRSYPSLFGAPGKGRVPDVALLDAAALAGTGSGGIEAVAQASALEPLRSLQRVNADAVLLQVLGSDELRLARGPGALLAAARAGFERSHLDGYWLRAGAVPVPRLTELRHVVGEDGLLVLEDLSGESEPAVAGPLLNGVVLGWSVATESARQLEARLAAWEAELRDPVCVAVELDLAHVDQGRARLAWTWLLARHDGVVGGLPAELSPGRLGQPVEACFHDESGTIQRDFDHGRVVSTAVSWAWTRVRMDGPHQSLFHGDVAWEHVFPPESSDVLLDLASRP